MAVLKIPVCAYKLTLKPQSAAETQAGRTMPGFKDGATMASGWTDAQITDIFREANAIWMRLADICFGPVTVSDRTETVPYDENNIWYYALNHFAPPSGIGVAVYFVGELIDSDGGWSHGRISLISGKQAKSGSKSFGGGVLAHELGHLLLADSDHIVAGTNKSNLMHDTLDKNVNVQGLIITPEQRQDAIKRVVELTTPPKTKSSKP